MFELLGGNLDSVLLTCVFRPVPLVVRFLLVNNHCISDPTAGVTQSLRTIMEWLADAGHACHILTTARFESPVTFTIEDHLRAAGRRRCRPRVAAAADPGDSGKKRRVADRPVVHYAVKDVPVTLLLTRHNDESRPDRAEAAQYLALLDRLLDDFAPDQLIACNGHPMIFEAMARARARGVTTAFAVRGFGYYEPRYFEDVDHAFTCSQFLTDLYREKVGLISTPIEPPIDWSTVVAPDRVARVRHLRPPVAAQGPAALRAPRRHARIAAAGHSRSWSCSPARAAAR